jgi:hypothetical protein
MAKNKATEPQPKEKVFASADEISHSIVKLRARIHQVEELKRDGLPYRDALRVTAEYQIRDTIRDIFGERAPEYLDHQHLRIRVNNKHSINETISLLQHLVVSLEERRLDLLGLRSKPEAKGEVKSSPSSGKQGTIPVDQVSEPAPPVQPTLPPSVAAPIIQTIPSPEPARVALTVEVKQPEMAPPAVPVAPSISSPPIMLVSQTKLKLSAEAIARSTEEPPAPQPEPLRFQRSDDDPEDSPTQPLSESTMATKLRFPSAEPAVERIEPQRPHATSVPGTGRNGQTGSPAERSSDSGSQEDMIDHLRAICSAFHRVARQLRQRRDERPTLEVEDERDVLDLLQALLTIEYDNMEPEEWAPAYASGTTRTDLWLKDEGVVIIAKKTKQGIGAKALTHQVSVDFERYGSHPDCKLMFCFIYDPEGRIGNPKGLEGDLTLNYDGRRIEVMISPK